MFGSALQAPTWPLAAPGSHSGAAAEAPKWPSIPPQRLDEARGLAAQGEGSELGLAMPCNPSFQRSAVQDIWQRRWRLVLQLQLAEQGERIGTCTQRSRTICLAQAAAEHSVQIAKSLRPGPFNRSMDRFCKQSCATTRTCSLAFSASYARHGSVCIVCSHRCPPGPAACLWVRMDRFESAADAIQPGIPGPPPAWTLPVDVVRGLLPASSCVTKAALSASPTISFNS